MDKGSKSKRKRKRFKKKTTLGLSFEDVEHELENIFKHPTSTVLNGSGSKLGKHTRYNDDGDVMDKAEEDFRPPHPKYRLTDPTIDSSQDSRVCKLISVEAVMFYVIIIIF